MRHRNKKNSQRNRGGLRVRTRNDDNTPISFRKRGLRT